MISSKLYYTTLALISHYYSLGSLRHNVGKGPSYNYVMFLVRESALFDSSSWIPLITTNCFHFSLPHNSVASNALLEIDSGIQTPLQFSFRVFLIDCIFFCLEARFHLTFALISDSFSAFKIVILVSSLGTRATWICIVIFFIASSSSCKDVIFVIAKPL